MSGQEGFPWRGEKVHIIDGSIYKMIREGKWSKNKLIIKKMVTKGIIGRTPGLQGFAK